MGVVIVISVFKMNVVRSSRLESDENHVKYRA